MCTMETVNARAGAKAKLYTSTYMKESEREDLIKDNLDPQILYEAPLFAKLKEDNEWRT